MNKRLKELIEKRGALNDKMNALLKKAEAEKRELTEAEETEYKGHEAEFDSTDAEIARLEKAESRNLKLAQRQGLQPVASASDDHLSKKDVRDLNSYSLISAIRSVAFGEPLEGLEREMHQEAAKEARDAQINMKGNLLVPQIIMNRSRYSRNGPIESRDMTATGGTAGDQGGIAVQTDVGTMIERLRARLMVAQMGATQLSGLQGNIDFPKFVANDTAVEKTENAASAESSPTLTKVSLAPNRLPIFAEVSRQLLLQTSPSVEAMLRDDLAFQLAKRMDAMAINGTGSPPVPEGILQTTGIGAVVGGTDGAAPDWADIVGLETAVAVDDADVGSLGYLTNPNVRGKLKVTSKAGTEAIFVWGEGAEVNGYRAGVSTQVPNNLVKGGSGAVCSAIIFGNWRDLLLAQWGGIEFLINPYSLDTTGLIRINAWTFYDVAVRHPESFAAMKDALTA